MKRFLSRSIPALALLALASPVRAEQLNVSARILPACAVVDPAAQADVVMNDYVNLFDAAEPAPTGSGSLTAFCTAGTPIFVTAGGTPSGAAPARMVTDSVSSDTIRYTLALTSGGADLPLTSIATGLVANGKAGRTVTFHATLDTADAANKSAGDYADTVLVTFSIL
jgi:spore coat protein U-like protein